MLIKLGDHASLQIGQKVFRYLLSDSSVYDKGPVVEMDDDYVVVDFGDSIRRFAKVQLSFVIDSHTADEYFMTIVEGEVLQDFKVRAPLADDMPDDFSDLLEKLNETSRSFRSSRPVWRSHSREVVLDQSDEQSL